MPESNAKSGVSQSNDSWCLIGPHDGTTTPLRLLLLLSCHDEYHCYYSSYYSVFFYILLYLIQLLPLSTSTPPKI